MTKTHVYAIFDIVTGDWVSLSDKPYITKASSKAEAGRLFTKVDESSLNFKSGDFIYYDEKHKVMLDTYDDRHSDSPRGFVGLIEVIG